MNEIIWHNVDLVDNLIRNNSAEMEPWFSRSVFHYYARWRPLEHKIGYSWIDRSFHKTYHLRVKSTPYRFYKRTTTKFVDLCAQRADEILSQSKVVNVFWSGGLDSTCALLALLAMVKSPNQIRVLMNYGSIVEGSTIFEKLRHWVECRIGQKFVGWQWPEPSADELYVSGAAGDCLFGNVGDMTREELLAPWQERAPKMAWLSVETNPTFRKIENAADYCWFESFNFRYDQPVGILKSYRPKAVFDNALAFYRTDYFDDWCVSNHEPSMPNLDPLEHKTPMRRAIIAFGGDREYAINKQKVRSVERIWPTNWVFALDDGRNAFLENDKIKLV